MLKQQKTSKSSFSQRILHFPEQGVMLGWPNEENLLEHEGNLRENGKILGIWRQKNVYLEKIPIIFLFSPS